MTQVTESIQLTAGTHQVECLITGPENTSYVDQKCRAEIIPTPQPTGTCQPGDDISGSSLCPGDDTGIGADIPVTIVSACTASRKCEYTCNPGYTRS